MHDTSLAKQSCYNTSTSGGTGLQPKFSLGAAHFQGSVVTSLAWSHNNQIIASGATDGNIILSSAATGAKVH